MDLSQSPPGTTLSEYLLIKVKSNGSPYKYVAKVGTRGFGKNKYHPLPRLRPSSVKAADN